MLLSVIIFAVLKGEKEEVEKFAIKDMFVEKVCHFELMIFEVIFFEGSGYCSEG